MAGELLKAGLVDELCIYLSPMLIGGPIGAAGGRQWLLDQAPRFARKECRLVGKDVFLRFEPVAEET